ncbi:PAS domain-containing protein [Photobacterium sagamiensis]|uniref:helix-turn-helix transcriptional regulator n=1 Tax=Photobacterium sagamiensis TaxID=2910241 RepID=UPI003D0E93E8
MKQQEKPNNAELLLQRYASVADGIALLFSDYVEVIIHDLESQTVVYIANNISKRKVGDPAALDDVNFEQTETVIGPYEKLNWDGKTICSTSVVIRDDENTPIGMLCINMNTAPVEAARAALDLLLPVKNLIPQPEKLFHDDWQEKANSFIHAWLANNHQTISALSRTDKRVLVEALYKEGAFNGKSSADYIASVLNMGRATVFNYLREIKKKG